jgi:hypothetical protein
LEAVLLKNYTDRSVRLRLGIRLLLAVLAVCVSSTALEGQSTGSLTGVVEDSSKAVIPGAKIEVINQASKARRTATAGKDGLFSVQALQAATYDLKVSAKGFETYVVTGIQIDPGDHRSVPNILLNIGEVNAQVTVNATVAGVSLDTPERSSLITAEDIQRLSTVGRDATELIKMLPGFAVSTGGGLGNSNTSNNAQTMGFGSSSTSSFSANGATPQTGATQVVSDGASTVDPGDMGASIANINMDMVAEIKVQTSNFGADSAKGPVVINAVGKSGGSSYHGTAYLFARNGAINANEWLNNYNAITRPNSSYYFPGFNVGGPIKIPGTNFNHSKKLTFFTGFEVYRQNVFQQTLTSFIPTAAMLGGDLTPKSIAAALNVSQSVLTTQCPNFYTSGTLSAVGGICYSPGYNNSSTYTQQYQQINAGTISANGQCDLNATPALSAGCLPVDPRALIYAKFWPKPNRTPQAGNGLASDGYNYVKAVTATDNGYQYRFRVDENFTDNTKLYVTYNYENINGQSPIQDGYYAGNDIIEYPTSAYSHTRSNSLSLNFTHVFSSNLTNEAVAAGTYFYQPLQLDNRSLVQDSSTGWTGGRHYNNGALQLPGIIDYEDGVPDFAMTYFPENSRYFRKFSYNVADNLTWQYHSHTLKFGVYDEVTANNQVPYNFTQGQYAFNHYNAGCVANDGNSGHISQLQNNVANFLQGCGGFTQTQNSNPIDLHFKTIDFYATDEWKVNKQLTLTLGIRFDHMGPWEDPHGVGLAVWTAPQQHVLYTNVTNDPKTYPGISWHGKDSSIPISGAPSRLLFYSPRVGLAYDMYGNGRTMIRGGWGVYRFHDSYNDGAGPLSTTSGAQSFATSGNLSCTYAQVGGTPLNGVPQVCNSTTAGAFGIYALDPKDDKQPVTYNYNFTVDQQFAHGLFLDMAYVGNRSADTLTAGNLDNQNYIPLGGLFQPDPLTGAVSQPGNAQQNQQDYRPYPNYTTVSVPSHIGYGNYNALQVSLNKQKGKFIFGANYTWAKALGIRGDYRTGAVGDPSTLRNNYGYLGFNRTHAGNFTYSYQVGNAYRGNRLVATVLNQWEFSGITGIQSGPDVAVLSGSTNFGLSAAGSYTAPGSSVATPININNTSVLGTPDISLQPVVTCNPSSNLQKGAIYGKQYINGNCFALPALGQNGNFELPDIHGPAYFSSDLTVQRTIKLTERQNLQFRMAGFNFLNHPLPQFTGGSQVGLSLGFGDPAGATYTTPQAAIAAAVPNRVNFGFTPYKTGFRIVEFGARYNF